MADLKFTTYTIDNAPEKSRKVLQDVKRPDGSVYNLHGIMAESAALLEAYHGTWQAFFTNSSLTPVEQQIVALTVSFENECEYCMAAHTALAKDAGMDQPTIEALRHGTPLPDTKQQALREFTRQLVSRRGKVTPADIESFIEAGFTKGQLFDVIAGTALKTMSNYVNRIAGTTLDKEFRQEAWRKPSPAHQTA